jgi:hypothetical protein
MEATRPDLLPINHGILWGPDPSQATPGMFDDLHLPAERRFDPLDEAALLVGTISPDELETGQAARKPLPAGVCRRGDPGGWLRAPACARSTRGYPQADGACGPSPFFRHHTREAPFLTGFHRSLLSMIAALGVGLRPAFMRTCSRNAVCMRFHVPSLRHFRK